MESWTEYDLEISAASQTAGCLPSPTMNSRWSKNFSLSLSIKKSNTPSGPLDVLFQPVGRLWATHVREKPVSTGSTRTGRTCAPPA
jgi:hypothetical protein